MKTASLIMSLCASILILLNSCNTPPPLVIVKKADTAKSIANSNDKDILANKLIADFESNKLTEIQSNQAFLLAKTYQFENKLEQAEKLFDLQYKYSPSTTVALNLIQIKIELKKISDAKEIAKHAHVIFPNSSEILAILIQIYQIENNKVQVSNLLNEGHKKFPKNESIAIQYAFFNKKQAKVILESFIEKNPNSPNALLSLSLLYYKDKNYSQALKYAKKSHAFDIDNMDAIVTIAKIEETLKNYAEAEKYYKIAFEKDMENNINAQNYLNILLFQKKHQEALSILLKLEASSDSSLPFPPEFSFEIGRLLILNQDFAGAKKRFETLLSPQLSPSINQDEVRFFLAYSCENLHLFQEALTHLDKINPSSQIASTAKKQKIFVYINSKQNEMAIEAFNNFSLSKNFQVDDILFKASILLYFSKNDEALKLVNESIQNKPQEKELYLKRIEIYSRTNKNIDFIISECKKVLQKWPKYGDALNLYGYLLVTNSKNLPLAEKLLKKAISLDPQNPYYLDSIGYLYFKKNNLSLAQKYFIESLKYAPNEPVILFHYAKVLKLLKNDQEATKLIEKARTIISNMLIYSIESDDELESIAKTIGTI